MIEALETLVKAAVLAPSGDNRQPWRFELDPLAGQVALILDEKRDLSPMNACQRMSRIACGAALENMLRTAQRHGWTARCMPTPSPHTYVLEIDNVRSSSVEDRALFLRATNRRVYERLPLPGGARERLCAATPELDGARTCWATAPEQIRAFSKLEGRAFEHMYGSGAMRRAILGNIRFDEPPHSLVEEGLSLGSLELTRLQQMLLRMLGFVPDGMLKCSGSLKAMAAHVRRLVNSASGLCVILAPDARPETDIVVGRCLQRAWLALTEMGLAAQPMMALSVLENAVAHGSREMLACLDVNGIRSLLSEWPAAVPAAEDLRPAFVLRFGYANAPSGRTGRRPVRAVTHWHSAEHAVAEARA